MKLLTSAIAGIVISTACICAGILDFRTVEMPDMEAFVICDTVEECETSLLVPILETLPEPVIEEEIEDTQELVTEPPVTSEPVVNIPEPAYTTISDYERDMLARLVYLEAGICSQECQRAIASVVFNRLDSGRWSLDMNNDKHITLYDIVYYPAAFSPAHLIYKTEAPQECYDAVDYVVKHGPTVPEYVRYFRIDYDFGWENYAHYTTIDNTYFGYFVNWEKGAW